MTHIYSLKKYERLKSTKVITALFQSGEQQYFFPLKCIYLIEPAKENEWPLKFSVSVPKKKHKSAVKRNLIKRRIREAYRLNKIPIQNKLSEGNYNISLMFVYLENEILDYLPIEKSIKKHLEALYQKISD